METTTPLSPYPISIYVASAIFTAIAGIAVGFWFSTETPFKGCELALGPKDGVSPSEAEKAYAEDGIFVLERGIQKFHRRAFQIYSEAGPQIILPSSRYGDETRSDRRFNAHDAPRKFFMIDLPGFDGLRVVTQSQLLLDVVKTNLKSGLGYLNEGLLEEVHDATETILGQPTEWMTTVMLHPCYQMVARISSRVFLGLPLCRDARWLDVAAEYTSDLFEGTRTLRFWPERLRPFVHWFLPQCRKLRATLRRARAVLTPEIAKMRVDWERRQAVGDKRPAKNVVDMLLDMAKKKGYPADKIDFVVSELGLTAAAMHTTTDMVMQTLFDLCCYPEYFEPLRKEIDDVLAATGGVLSPTTKLSDLRFMDSLMKEVQRMKPATLTSSKRITTEDLTLSDGTFLPKGSYLALYNDARVDGSVYPEPERFDPYRALRARAEPGKENAHQFVSTSPVAAGFGHGTYACPGRFFANNEIKLLLCALLIRYDWKLPEGAEKPKPMLIGAEFLADPTAQLMYRKRVI